MYQQCIIRCIRYPRLTSQSVITVTVLLLMSSRHENIGTGSLNAPKRSYRGFPIKCVIGIYVWGGNVHMCWVCCNPYVVLFWGYAHMETLTFPNHERNANQTFPLLSTPLEIRHPSIHAHTALTSASRNCTLWESGLGMTYSRPLACLWSLLVSCYLSLLQYFLLFILFS